MQGAARGGAGFLGVHEGLPLVLASARGAGAKAQGLSAGAGRQGGTRERAVPRDLPPSLSRGLPGSEVAAGVVRLRLPPLWLPW